MSGSGQFADRLRRLLSSHQAPRSSRSTDDAESAPRPDLRLVPVAAGLWFGAFALTGADHTVAYTVAAGALVLLLVVLALSRPARRWMFVAAALAVLTGSVLGGVHRQLVVGSVVAELGREQAVVVVRLELRGDPQLKPGDGPKPAFLTRTARTVSIDGRGHNWAVRSSVLVVATGRELADWQRWPVGSTVETVARLQPSDRPGEIAALAQIRGPTSVVGQPSAGLRLVEHVRQGLREAVAHRRPDQRALVPALVLGDTGGITDRLRADFQTTSLTHLMAVSGANLTLLLAFVLLIARWVGVRGWWLRVLGLLGVIVFVALCRSEPSVLRAAAMGLVALAATGVSGPSGAMRNLSLAIVALLVADPWLSRTYGFALSVLASAGIVWWARRWAALLSRWLPGVLAEALVIPLAAHLATLPLIVTLSGQVSLIGVIANVFAGPFVGPATVLGFAAAGLSLVGPGVAAVPAFGAAWTTQLIIWIAHLGAATPGAALSWPTTPSAVLLLTVGCVFAAVAMPFVLRRPIATLGLAVLMIAVALRPLAQPGWPPPGWQIVACDVGQGDGVVVRVDARQAVVFDAGPDPEKMKRCLDQLGIRAVPLLVFTHFHADHVGGLDGVLAGRSVGELWLSPLAEPAAEAARVRSVAVAHGLRVLEPPVGEEVIVGPLRLRVLGPVIRPPLVGPIAVEDSSSRQNDESIVTLVRAPGVSMLETGDVEPPQQSAIMDSGADLRADVLKIPHHGSGNQNPAFIRASGARLAIASAGLHNDYGHPAPRTVALVRADAMTLLRTDQQGSVAIAVRNGQVVAVTQR